MAVLISKSHPLNRNPLLPICTVVIRTLGPTNALRLGEESYGFQGVRLDGTRTDSAACPTVPLESWEELADFLHTAELSPYHPLEPRLMDATDSKIQVTWQEDGESLPTATVVSMPTSC